MNGLSVDCFHFVTNYSEEKKEEGDSRVDHFEILQTNFCSIEFKVNFSRLLFSESQPFCDCLVCKQLCDSFGRILTSLQLASGQRSNSISFDCQLD